MIHWIFLLLPMTAISGLLYYLGGESGWNTKVRDWGCNTIACALIMSRGFDHWSILLVWVLMWGALSTYWKKGTDCKWYHWLAHGAGIGASFTPYAIMTGHWTGLIVYTALVAISFAIWSEINDDVRYEASGRGAFMIIYLPALLI